MSASGPEQAPRAQKQTPPPRRVWPPLLLAGPTAVGKSALALSLAEALDAEIVSVDSMQVYRGLDLGTAKPSAADQARVRHHLIDVVDLTESFDVAQFAQRARQAVAEIQARGKLPILCGGTGLYFRAFRQGLSQTPAPNPELRRQLEQAPLAEMLRELAERDPALFQVIDRHNRRRVVRALEVIRQTGQPYSPLRARWTKAPTDCVDSFFALLEREDDDLRQRIEARVDWMFAHGLVAETQALLQRGLAQNRTALQALGYRQVVDHLQGKRSLTETILLVKQRTRQFAKRQMTWFRQEPGLRSVRLAPSTLLETPVEELAKAYRSFAKG